MYDIELNNVSVHYGGVVALKDINLRVKEKEFLAIIGPNGGGKTTLLKVLLGIIKSSKGSVVIKENKTIGYVPQFTQFSRDFPIRVMDVILMGTIKKGMRLFHRYSSSDVKKVESLMEELGIIQFKDRQIGQLSGGQLQKVLIARALAATPQILLLDEPTASIDAQSKTEIYHILKRLNKEITIILVTHDMEVISSYVDSIACLNQKLYYHEDGKLTEDTIQKVYGCPVDIVAHGFPHRVLRKHRED